MNLKWKLEKIQEHIFGTFEFCVKFGLAITFGFPCEKRTTILVFTPDVEERISSDNDNVWKHKTLFVLHLDRVEPEFGDSEGHVRNNVNAIVTTR